MKIQIFVSAMKVCFKVYCQTLFKLSFELCIIWMKLALKWCIIILHSEQFFVSQDGAKITCYVTRSYIRKFLGKFPFISYVRYTQYFPYLNWELEREKASRGTKIDLFQHFWTKVNFQDIRSVSFLVHHIHMIIEDIGQM